MVKKMTWAVSLGGQYWLSSLFYVGMGCLLIVITPKLKTAMADGTAYLPCPEGQIPCGGDCISDTMICCEDGTSGNSETCVCCTGCSESTCTNESTVKCESDFPDYTIEE